MVQSRTSISAIGPRRERLAAHDSPKHLEIFSLGASRRPSGRSTIHPSCAGPPVAQGERTPASRRKACDLSHAERAGNPDHAVARVALLVLAASSGPRSNMAALPIVSSFSVRRPAHHRVYSTPGGCRRRIGRARVTPRAGVRALQRGNSLSEYRTANRRILFPVSTRASAVNAMIGIDRTA
jgi:hypothetical protein